MATVLPIEIFELLEEKVGKESAKEVIKIIEEALNAIEEKSKEVALQRKLEIKEELTKELVTKADLMLVKTELEGKIDKEISRLEGKIDKEISKLEGEIKVVKSDIDKINMKLNFLIILVIIALTLMNPVVAELIMRFLR